MATSQVMLEASQRTLAAQVMLEASQRMPEAQVALITSQRTPAAQGMLEATQQTLEASPATPVTPMTAWTTVHLPTQLLSPAHLLPNGLKMHTTSILAQVCRAHPTLHVSIPPQLLITSAQRIAETK